MYNTAFRLVPVGLEPTTVMHAEAENGDSREHASARPVTITRPVSCEELDHVPGKSITTAIVEFPPNAYTPRHRHLGSVTVFVLKGRIRSQFGGGPVDEFGVGDSFFEPLGKIHLFAENASVTKAAELLAVFVADHNCGPMVIYVDQ